MLCFYFLINLLHLRHSFFFVFLKNVVVVLISKRVVVFVPELANLFNYFVDNLCCFCYSYSCNCPAIEITGLHEFKTVSSITKTARSRYSIIFTV